MGDDLDDLFLGDAVVEGAVQVAAQLVGAVERSERGNRDQTAIALRKLLAFPDVAEHDFVADLAELGEHVLDLRDGRRGWLRGHETVLLNGKRDDTMNASHVRPAKRTGIDLRVAAPRRGARR